jgi:hypothetical protein
MQRAIRQHRACDWLMSLAALRTVASTMRHTQYEQPSNLGQSSAATGSTRTLPKIVLTNAPSNGNQCPANKLDFRLFVATKEIDIRKDAMGLATIRKLALGGVVFVRFVFGRISRR